MEVFRFFLILIIIVALSYLFGFTGATILKVSQPDSVTYDAEYELNIEEGLRKLQLFDFRRLSEIKISRQGGEFSYGHSIDIDVLGSDISKTNIQWLESGVNLQFDSGHSLFIPKKAFEGGR